MGIDKKKENRKLKTIKEESQKEEKEELSNKLSKAAEDAMRSGDYERLGKIIENAQVEKVTINANIKNK